jgi:hypothetical protein
MTESSYFYPIPKRQCVDVAFFGQIVLQKQIHSPSQPAPTLKSEV